MNTDMSLKAHEIRAALRRLMDRLPEEFHNCPEYRELDAFTQENAITVVHFINRRRKSDSHTKDYEFSRTTMREHWTDGIKDVRTSLDHQEWIKRRLPEFGVAVFDLVMNKVKYTGADGLEEVHDKSDREDRKTETDHLREKSL
jgi:NTE family protein